MKKRNRGIIAIVCIMALLISSFTTYTAKDVKAGMSETIDGITYTVTNGSATSWTGATCQGIYTDGSNRIHFAWGISVLPESIAVEVNGVSVAVNGTSAGGCFIYLDAAKNAVNSQPGDYDIDLSATSSGETPENLSWSCSLKMESAEQPTTDESGVTWVDIAGSNNLKYDSSTTTRVVSWQRPFGSEDGVYVNCPDGAGAPTSITINGVTTSVAQGENTAFYCQGAGLLLYGSMFNNVEITEMTITYASYGDATLRIKNTSVQPTESSSETSSETVSESSSEEGSTPAVQSITIIPRSNDIETYKQIFADWTNPSGTSYTYAYINEVSAGKGPIASNGWDFNSQATQPMTGLDTVVKTKDETITITQGVTYTLIVEAFNSNDQKIGRGTLSIRIPVEGEVGGDVVFNQTYRQELVIDGTAHYAIYAYWNSVPGAAGYKSYIDVEDDNHKAKASNEWIWSDQNLPAGSTDTHVDTVYRTKNDSILDDSTSYKLIVVACDSEGEEIGRGEITFDGKEDYRDLNYTRVDDAYTYDSQNTKLPVSYAIYDDESSYSMRSEAANWANKPHIYGDGNYAEVNWGDQSRLYNSPDKVTINGTDYTSSDLGPINNYAATLVQFQTKVSGGLHVGYNKVRVTKGDDFVTVIFRIGAVTAPVSVSAIEQSGVPGSVIVSWVPGDGTPDGQVFRVYVDGDMKKGNLTGTSAVINNIDAGSHTIKVVGFYLDTESDGPTDTVTVSTGVKYSSNISIEGFQIRSNYPDDATEQEKSNVAFRTMCKAPKAGSTVKVGGKSYSVASVGTIYAIDTNTKDKNGTNVLDASYTLLNETPVTGQQYSYTGYRKYNNNNVTYGYIASGNAIISDYKAGDTENTYYAFTMQGMNAQMANTLWVRPFIVATDGTIIYAKSTAYTSVAEIANVLYTNSMSKNVTSHDYLYNKILHNSILQTNQNPFYRDTQIQYGWNANLYIGFRLVPDSWNGGEADEGQYVVVGDWKIHNSSHYNEQISGKQAQASYKGNTNDEMQVRVDNPGAEFNTDGWMWNWGIQMKLANSKAYNRLEDGRKYRMTITYNTTKSGIMRIKTEGNSAADSTYMQPGHDLVYDFDAVAGGNSHNIEFTYNAANYVKNPGADPSIVICPGRFNVYPFGDKSGSDNNARSRLHIKYLGQYSETSSTVADVGGFPAGTIISDVDITFTEIDEFSPDSPNVLH